MTTDLEGFQFTYVMQCLFVLEAEDCPTIIVQLLYSDLSSEMKMTGIQPLYDSSSSFNNAYQSKESDLVVIISLQY
jgi:hypothetical protein